MRNWGVTIIILMTTVVMGYYFYPESKLPADTKIDKLVVIKSDRIMLAYSKGQIIKTYKIALGQNSSGDKKYRGDKRTPEGEYKITDRNSSSGFHKNLGVSYPNKADLAEAKSMNLDPGGDIKIHGLKNGLGFIAKFHRLFNWTAGCVAVTNEEMDELYEAVEVGAPIIIKP